MIIVLHKFEASDTSGTESVAIGPGEGLDKNRYMAVVCQLSDR